MKKIELDKELIINLFCYKNYTDKEIGKEFFGCSEHVIGRFRRANRIDRLHKNDEWLIKKREEGLNDTEIAKIISCNPGTISKAFKRIYGTSNPKKTYTINNNLFSGYSKEECYWAGFILADGHIEEYMGYGRNTANSKLAIKISKKDKKHLIKFNKFLGDKNIAIKDKEVEAFGKIHHTSEVKISRKHICDNLINQYEIFPANKSTKEFISSKIPKEMLSHFIRGYFDGDGSIYKKNDRNAPGVTIVGSKVICEQLKDYFGFGHIYHDINDLYRYEIFKKSEVECFRDIIYRDSNEMIKLDRKYDKFKTFSYTDKRFSVNS